MIKVGILELQGDFELHHNILRELGYTSFSVKESTDLENLDQHRRITYGIRTS